MVSFTDSILILKCDAFRHHLRLAYETKTMSTFHEIGERQKFLFENLITHDADIHPRLTGSNVLKLLKREQSNFVDNYRLYDVFTMASIIERMIFHCQFKLSWDMIGLCQSISLHYHDHLINKNMSTFILALQVLWVDQKRKFNHQRFLCNLIREHMGDLIPGATADTGFRFVKGHIPDFMVRVDATLCPVEVKASDIDSKALHQVRRYMRVYDCERGYLMGKRLTVDIDDPNIHFVDISNLRNRHYPQE